MKSYIAQHRRVQGLVAPAIPAQPTAAGKELQKRSLVRLLDEVVETAGLGAVLLAAVVRVVLRPGLDAVDVTPDGLLQRPTSPLVDHAGLVADAREDAHAEVRFAPDELADAPLKA